MRNGSRTLNTVRNMGVGMVSKVISIILPFIIRTILIYKLGADYVGLGSLFSSILQVLSVTELGFSSAITFCLYKPVAERQINEIQEWLTLYRHVYHVVGTVIGVVGICILPFLRYLIKGSYPSDINLYLLYLIYLSNTVISYFAFSYKNVVLIVNQRRDILGRIDITLSIIRSLVQICALQIVTNYYWYVLWFPVFTLVSNLTVNAVSNKVYPEYTAKRGEYNRSKLLEISNQIKGVAVGRISLVTRDSFDSLILSGLCGLTVVTIYSNYFYIISSISSILGVLLMSASASIGNSWVTETLKKNIEDHNRFDFYYMWISGWCTVCLICLFQPFMKIWVGEELMLPFPVMLLFCGCFYVDRLSQVRALYSEAAGLWWNFRYVTIVGAIANVALNFLLGYIWGITGILIATITTTFAVSFISISLITYKRAFKVSAARYYISNLLYALVTAIVGVGVYYICQMLDLQGLVEIGSKIAILVFIPNILFGLIYLAIPQTREYIKQMPQMAKKILKPRNG